MAVWQVVFCLTFLAFAFRSVLPAGYMPDTAGAREGRLALTLCIAANSTGVAKADAPDSSGAAADDSASVLACPFGIIAAQALLPAQPVLAVAGDIAHHPAPAPRRNRALPPLPASGPALGPRAPPLLSA